MSAFQRRNVRSTVMWWVAAALAVAAGTLAAFDRLAAGPAFTKDFTLTTAADFLGGSFYRTGIVNNAGGEVELLPIGVAGLWVTDTQQLPAGRSQLGAVAYGGRVYALGGLDSFSNPTAQVYMSGVSNDSLTGWAAQAHSLPLGVAGHLAFAAAPGGQPYLYAVGGYFVSGQNSNKIFYAPISGDGSVGVWLTNTVDLPIALTLASGVIFNNRMYVVGGTDTGGTYRSEAYSAPLNPDGSVGAWRSETPLPQPLARTAAVVFGGALSNTIYVLGGATSAVTNSLNVYFADIVGGGVLTPWQTSSGNLPDAFSSHAAVQTNGQIYIIGGNTGGDSTNLQPRKIVLSALVDESNPARRLVDFGGGQSSWVETEPLPIPRRYHGAVSVAGELFAIGGDSSATLGIPSPSAITYHGPTTGAASRYAPSGNYRSPVIDTGGLYEIYQFAWSTVMTNAAALTLTMQFHTSSDGVTWSGWSAPLASNPQQSASLADPKSITYTLNTNARYFQYQGVFTTTSNTATPFLLESHVIVIIPPPNLAVSKSTAGVSAVPGSVVTYTINYTNVGIYTSGGGVLTETVPANTTYVDIGAGWSQVGATSQYTKTVASLPPGISGTAQFAVQVNGSPPPGTESITNTVRIGGDPLESDFSNNVFSLSTSLLGLVPGVDLRVTGVDDGISNPDAGQVLTYTIAYRNYGTDPAPASVLTVTLPLGITGLGGAGWVDLGGGAWLLSLGTLNSAQLGSAQFSAQVNSNVVGASYLTTTARIGFSGTDVNPGNNAGFDTDWVKPGNLQLIKDDGRAAVAPGQTLVYSLTYANAGGAVVSGIVLTDTPPLALVDVPNPGGWTLAGGVYTMAVAPLAPGQSGVVTFSVQVKNGIANGTWITNTASIGSPADDQTQLYDNSFQDADVVLAGGAPDLRILGASLVGDAILFRPANMVVTVTNSGPISTGVWFYTDLYKDIPPILRTDLGTTYYPRQDDPHEAWDAGQTRAVTILVTFDAPGLHQVYFQVDTCDTSSDECLNRSYGRVAESNEANNIFGPVYVEVKPVAVFLPLIAR